VSDQLDHILRMLSVAGVGPRRTLDLIDAFKTLEGIFSASYAQLTAIPGIKEVTARAILEPPDQHVIAGQRKLIEKFQVKLVTLWDDVYPHRLREIYDPPIALFCRGDLSLLDTDGLGIVGTRTPTAYGKRVAREFGGEISKHGLTIISGAAKGVDALVHQAALAAGGKTIAVLGCGVDRVYPAENRELLDEISRKGLLVSEFLMGSKPDAQNFPRRNRIISGLSLGTLAVEAAEKSGSLITTYFALDQNREVFAIPGPVDSRQSRGTNQLIKQGAKLVDSIEDILDEFGDRYKMGSSSGQQSLPIGLDPAENHLIALLNTEEPIHIDDLSATSGVTTFALLGTLLQLEMKGLVQQLPGKYFKRR